MLFKYEIVKPDCCILCWCDILVHIHEWQQLSYPWQTEIFFFLGRQHSRNRLSYPGLKVSIPCLTEIIGRHKRLLIHADRDFRFLGDQCFPGLQFVLSFIVVSRADILSYSCLTDYCSVFMADRYGPILFCQRLSYRWMSEIVISLAVRDCPIARFQRLSYR